MTGNCKAGEERRKVTREQAPELLKAGCSRDVIKDGAERLGWEIADLFDKTIKAMQSCEKKVEEECK